MTRPDIEAIKKHVYNVIRGPWSVSKHDLGKIVEAGVILATVYPDTIEPYRSATATFIARSRQDVPDLIAWIEHLEAQLKVKGAKDG